MISWLVCAAGGGTCGSGAAAGFRAASADGGSWRGRSAASACEVFDLVGEGGNPHRFEPRPADMAKMRDSALVLAAGKGLEPYLDRLRDSLGRRDGARSGPDDSLADGEEDVTTIMASPRCGFGGPALVARHFQHGARREGGGADAWRRRIRREARVYRANAAAYVKRLGEPQALGEIRAGQGAARPAEAGDGAQCVRVFRPMSSDSR